MADDTSRENANVYTEAQHFALLTSAVERETASLTETTTQLEAQVAALSTEKAGVEAELSTAKDRIDVLEAEKASAETAAATARQELEDFKAELARQAEVASRKTDRVARVKAANANLDDSYFTDERVTRWAEMADEQFEALVADMTEAAAAVKPAEVKTGDATEQARETAAFSGGTAPTGEGTTFAQFLSATGIAPIRLHS